MSKYNRSRSHKRFGGKSLQTIDPPGTIVTSQAQLDQIAKQKLEETGRSIQSGGDSEPTDPPAPAPVPVALTQEQLQGLINNSVQAGIDKAKAESKTALDQLNAQLAEAQAALAAEKAEKAAALTQKEQIVSVLTMMGHSPNPASVASGNPPSANFNTHIGTKWDTPLGAAKAALELIYKQNYVKQLESGQRVQHGADLREFNEFVKANEAHFMRDFGEFAKQNGLLQGRSLNAATIATDLPTGFLPTLSALILRRKNRTKIFHQFAAVKFRFEAGMGDLIKIPRVRYQTEPTSENDRLLSGLGVYNPIDPGSQNIRTGESEVRVQEYGYGGNPTNPPITLVTFVEALSMFDLLNRCNEDLGHDYLCWEDVTIRDYLVRTSAVRYNDGGFPTANIGDLAAGDNGTMTLEFLNRQAAAMASAAVPTFRDGRYALICDPITTSSIITNLYRFFAPATEAMLMELTNILNPSTIQPGEMERISGYMGVIGNLHLFQTNNWAVGASPNPGIVNQVVAGTARDLRESLFIGDGTVGRGIAMAMQIVQDEVRDFGRRDRYIWKSGEGFTALDIDATAYNDTSEIPQETRVYKSRTLERAI